MNKSLGLFAALAVAIGGAGIASAQRVSVTPAVTHCYSGGIALRGANPPPLEVACAKSAKAIGKRTWRVTHDQAGNGLPRADVRIVYESAEVDRLLAIRDQRILALEQTLENLKATLLTDGGTTSKVPTR